ncbi:unnamed protein product [Kuraishia capsulata CBS 1993]|uniref:Protein YAE1 n=1 Tax=Kuraishia capsulata CBS 1993 TaxID=1382522 RepID=W6MQE2_9ASCO|nr:uncharacterized protein KUCA_T00000070001 [Kuraishia capsulata CBS 1993]CDK24110.1 unnamed protein product [Kuraishia capsulata CBS 1993]
MDDVWSDDEFNFTPNSKETYGNVETTHMNINSLRQVHGKRGYLDGVSQSKESTIQEGFDSGFGIGLRIADQVGFVLGVLQFQATVDPAHYGEVYESAKVELNIQDLLKISSFDESLETFNNPTMTKWVRICDELK